MWENEKQIFVTHGLLKQDFTKENTILKRISVFWSKLHFQRQLKNKAGQLASGKITQIEETSQPNRVQISQHNHLFLMP